MAFANKSEKIKFAIDDAASKLFGRKTSESIKHHICVMCGEKAIDFKDELSKREFNISGLCDNCQAKIFFSDK